MGKTRQTGDIVSDGLVSVDIDNDQFKVGTGVTIYGSSGIISATSLYVGGTQFSAGISNVVEDSTPQLGGDLDLNSNDITGTGNFNVTGVITATSYDGQVKLSLEESDTTNYLTFANDSQGYQTLKSNTGLAFNASNGTLTATSFSGSGSNLTGVAKLSGEQLYSSGNLRFADDGGIYFGTGYDMYILHYTGGAGNTGNIIRSSNQDLTLDTLTSGDILLKPVGSVELYENGSKKLETTNGGVTVTGIVTATSFVKSGGTSSQYLMADGSTSTGGGGGSSTLSGLTDVSLSSPSNGQVLKYNGTNWVNGTDEGGAGSGVSQAKATAISMVFG